MWFPGAGFKKIAAEMRQVVHAMLNTPYEYTKRELVTLSPANVVKTFMLC